MDSLNKIIKTYVYNLSVFYCREPKINYDELNMRLNELNKYIISMFIK